MAQKGEGMSVLPTRKSDIKLLSKVRALFLNEHPEGTDDYWDSEEVLSLYDATFARRIAWKWDAIWGELARRQWAWPTEARTVIDWGCGTGAAIESCLRAFQEDGAFAHQASCGPTSVLLADRSARAMNFVEAKVMARNQDGTAHQQQRPLKVSRQARGVADALALAEAAQGPFVLLVSHVLTELDTRARSQLLALARMAQAVVWVEPGTPFCSRALVEVRAQLLGAPVPFEIIAPCTHQQNCALSAASGVSHWCHHFAKPPSEIFQDGEWVKLAKDLGIDLHSLPVSYLVAQRPSPAALTDAQEKAQEKSPGQFGKTGRIVGPVRHYKGHVKILVCEASGVSETTVQNRGEAKSWLKDLEQSPFEMLCDDESFLERKKTF